MSDQILSLTRIAWREEARRKILALSSRLMPSASRLAAMFRDPVITCALGILLAGPLCLFYGVRLAGPRIHEELRRQGAVLVGIAVHQECERHFAQGVKGLDAIKRAIGRCMQISDLAMDGFYSDAWRDDGEKKSAARR